MARFQRWFHLERTQKISIFCESLFSKISLILIICFGIIWAALVHINPGKINSVRYVETVNSLPKEAGELEMPSTLWRKYGVSVDRKSLEKLSFTQSTYYFVLTDCKGNKIWTTNSLIDGVSVLDFAHYNTQKTNDFLDKYRKHSLIFYADETDLKRSTQMCLRAVGGNSLFYSFKGNLVKFAP